MQIKGQPMPLIPPVPADRQAANSRFVQELLEFPARYLPELPLKLRIRVQAIGLHREIEITTSSQSSPRPGALLLNGGELRALALGAEAERLFPSDVKGYCLLKLHDPGFEISEELTLAGVEPLANPGWSLARVLNALDLELRSAELEEQAALGRPRDARAA